MINRNIRVLRTREILKKSCLIRLFIFKSNKYIYFYIIDDKINKILFSISTYKFKHILKNNKNIISLKILLIKLLYILKEKKIYKILFDRSGYRYHGNIKLISYVLKINNMVYKKC